MYWLTKFITVIDDPNNNDPNNNQYNISIYKNGYTLGYDGMYDVYDCVTGMKTISCMLTKDKGSGYKVQNIDIQTPDYRYYYTYSKYPGSGIILHGPPHCRLEIMWRGECCKKYKEQPIALHKKRPVVWYRYGKKISSIETPYIMLSRLPDGTTNITKNYNYNNDQDVVKFGHNEIRSRDD